jgi:hypothetical protein
MYSQPLRCRAAVLIVVVAALLSLSALPAAAQAGAPDQATHRAEMIQTQSRPHAQAGPRARAACPVCPIIAVTAIRTIAVRAAPVAIKAATRVGGTSVRARRRVSTSAKKVKTFTKRSVRVSGARLVVLFERLPKYARGCGRGFVDYIRDPGDLRLSAVFIACGRGILDIYLGKSPYRPIDR